MEEIFKTYKHNPAHLFIENAKYFITASTYKKQPFLKTDSAKDRLFKSLNYEFSKHGWTIEEWVILDNHYHLMAHAPENPSSLPNIIKEVHRFTALWIKKNIDLALTRSLHSKDIVESINHVDGTPTHSKKYSGRIFYNYWDTCITYENSYYARINYIWYNPVKHNYVKDPKDWKYGSYYHRIKNGSEEMDLFKEKYPWDKVNVKDDF